MRHLIFFLKFYLWFSLRNLRKHPGRTVTVIFGIALGAAVFTSVRLSMHASLNSFENSMNLLAGRAEHVLIRPGGRVPEAIISNLLTHPAVETASPLLTAYVRSDREGTDPFILIGLDPILDRRFRNWQISQSNTSDPLPWIDLIKEPYTLLLGNPVARQTGSSPGDQILLEHMHQKKEFRVLGLLDADGIALIEGGRVAVTDIATFQEFTGLYGRVDRIDLQLKPNATRADIENLWQTLPDGIVRTAPSAAKNSGQKLIRSYELNLSILSFASLFVGMFLVYSLVALNAASRRHELAILRSLGASRHLLFNIFLAEGAFFGIIGWILAIPISALLVKYLVRGVSQTIATLFVRVRVDTLTLSGWEILLSFWITLAIAVLAAFQPAREAMHVAPKEAMEMSQIGTRYRKSPKRLAWIGLCCILSVMPLSQLPGYFGIPLPGYLAMFLLFVGFSLTVPWLIEKTGHIFSPALQKTAGISAYLGSRYVGDSGTRTAVPVGALMTAVALFTALVIMIFSFRQTVSLWTHQTVSGDLFLTTHMGELNRFQYPIPEKTKAALQDLASDVDIVPNRRFSLIYSGFPYELQVFDMAVFLRYGDFVWLKKSPKNTRNRAVSGDGVLVSEVFSNRTGLRVGDIYRARVDASLVELPVIGIVRDYRTDGGVVFYSWHQFKKRFHDPGWSGVRFYIKDRTGNMAGAVADLRKEIIRHCGENLDMINGYELRASILKVFDETFAITTILLLIALIIAALGIATTLTVLVLERSQQLNTLFAVGASYGQIRSMIFWEAAFMVFVGELAGLACGFILSQLLVHVINRQSFGWTFMFGVDWATLGMSLPLIILTALAAALPAIRLVFREPPATLLRAR